VKYVVLLYSIKPMYCSLPSPYAGKMTDSKPPVAVLQPEMHPAWQGRSIAGPRLRLVEFSAFLEQQLQPDTDSV